MLIETTYLDLICHTTGIFKWIAKNNNLFDCKKNHVEKKNVCYLPNICTLISHTYYTYHTFLASSKIYEWYYVYSLLAKVMFM